MLDFDFNTILLAFGLTLFAGLSTGIGSLIALLAKKTNTRFLSVVLGFSAGVMIYVSMIEIFAEAKLFLTASLGESGGMWATVGSFFGGMFIIAVIDKLVPAADNPHEMRMVEAMSANRQKTAFEKENKFNIDPPRGKHTSHHHGKIGVKHKGRLMRLGLFTAVAIAIHNFPEGMATFIASLKDPSLGISIAVAIAIHNIPEGIAVSVPVFYATGDRKKAFRWSLLSGLSEPLGALVVFFALMPVINDVIFGILFASVAGIMVFISLDEILPTAREYGEPHLSIYGMIGGMAVMAVSLGLF